MNRSVRGGTISPSRARAAGSAGAPESESGGACVDRVDAGGEAYSLGHTPDMALALASAGVTLALVGMGAADRAERHPWIPLMASGKAAADVAAAV